MKMRKQCGVLAASILFLLVSIGYNINRHHHHDITCGQACSTRKNMCSTPVDACTVMNDELETMEGFAIVLEKAYDKDSDDITKENKKRILSMAAHWGYLIKQKNAYSKSEREKAFLSLRKNPKEILNRMHRAQAALLTKKDGRQLMIAVKIILDKSTNN